MTPEATENLALATRKPRTLHTYANAKHIADANTEAERGETSENRWTYTVKRIGDSSWHVVVIHGARGHFLGYL